MDEAGDNAARGRAPLETQVEASVSTPTMVAQLASHVTEAPGDFVLCEQVHTVSLQRQLQDSFSVGRFESEGAYGDFVDIGRIMFVPAGVPLHIRTTGRMTRTFRCFFRGGDFDALVGSDSREAMLRLHNCLNINSPQIRSLLMRMAQEIEAPGIASDRLLDAMGRVLQIEMARYVLESPSHLEHSRGGLSRGAYRRVVARIESDGAAPTLDELARVGGISVRQLTRAFRETTGVSVSQMIDEVRFKRSVLLLKDRSASIASVAESLGFKSGAAFSRAFRRWSGQSPQRFRAALERKGQDQT